jgi:hypothetical protein
VLYWSDLPQIETIAMAMVYLMQQHQISQNKSIISDATKKQMDPYTSVILLLCLSGPQCLSNMIMLQSKLLQTELNALVPLNN